MTRRRRTEPRRGPKPRPDANKELVHLRVSPELYDKLRAWAQEDGVSLSHELRGLALVGRLFFERPEFVRRMIEDPNTDRTTIIRDFERDAHVSLGATNGAEGATAG